MFTLPPLDGALTIPHLYDWHYQNNPDHPAFVFENDEGVLQNLLYSQLVPAIHRAGQYIASSIGIDVHANQNTYPVVALLSTAGTYPSHLFLPFLTDAFVASKRHNHHLYHLNRHVALGRGSLSHLPPLLRSSHREPPRENRGILRLRQR